MNFVKWKYVKHFLLLLEIFPSSNGTTGLAGLESINVITNALGSRSANLREMMRRATAAVRRPAPEVAERDAEAPSPSAEEPIPTLNWPPDPLSHSGDEDSFIDLASNANKQSTSQYNFLYSYLTLS